MSLANLHRRLDKLLAQADQLGDNDTAALEIITRSLCLELALITPDGSLPVDFEQRCKAIEQDITPAEQRTVEKFERRYQGEIDTLLQELERTI